MVQITTLLVATTLFATSALGAFQDQLYRRNEVFERDLERPVTREDIEIVMQRALDMADELDMREPLLGGIIRLASKTARAASGMRAAKQAVKRTIKTAFRSGRKAYSARQHPKHRHRRQKRDLEEREIQEGLYDDLD